MTDTVSAPSRVLVCDDNALVRRVVVTILEGAGYSVVESATTEEALAEIARTSPELVIMDLQVGTDSGVAAIEEIRRSPTHALTPILVVSGDTDIDGRASAAGADAYLTKPFGVETLTATVRSVISAPGAGRHRSAG